MKTLFRLIGSMTKVERIALTIFLISLFGSFAMLLRLFHEENTISVGTSGGTYIEGSVGEVTPLNPWFTTNNDINRDIVSLIFSGLLRFDPLTKVITDDLAVVSTSTDGKTYTAKLKPNLFWHDTSVEHPHPVTADDIMFTFKTIQDPEFPNQILQQNFRGVDIKKINESTVQFILNKPYSFFTSNLTLGLLPKASFDGVPIKKLKETLDFGFHPIGAGPYSFVSLLQTDLSTEITLKRFEREGLQPYNIDRMVLRIFSSYSSLLSDIMNLNAVRGAPRNDSGQPIVPKRFTALPYALPQYVGVFFNMSRNVTADTNVRLGLQLATNKQEIIDALQETRIIDTPLLEIDLGDWRYRFDAKAAKGAFFASNWNVPEKVRLQRLLEQRNANSIGLLRNTPHITLLGTGGSLTLTGSLPKGAALPLMVNGIRVQTGVIIEGRSTKTLSGTWIVKIPAGNGTSGSLALGLNIIRMSDRTGDIIDSAFTERVQSPRLFALADQENHLVDLFLQSKELPDTDRKKITIDDLYLESGYLRRKLPSDPPGIRTNDQGKKLRLTLLTSHKPESFAKVATLLQKQWKEVGVDVSIEIPETQKEFQDRLLNRTYDVVLFGESMLDNLDSYPYWHSSQAQDTSDRQKLRLDAFNLSQYMSLEADTLLALIRETNNASTRKNALKKLNDLFKKDVPAIMLYSPLFIYAHDSTIQGVNLGTLSLHADRFGGLADWYISTEKQFNTGKGWKDFLPWLMHIGKK